jgi:hypothetical protein
MSLTDSDIKIPGNYVIMKNNLEQCVTIDRQINENGIILYEYNYGVFGFHEGICSVRKIRNLTEKENQSLVNNKFLEVPQQFYQSTPNYY